MPRSKCSDSDSSSSILPSSPDRKLLDLEESSGSEAHSSNGFINSRSSSSNPDFYPSTPPAFNSRTFSYSSPNRSIHRSPPSSSGPVPTLSEQLQPRSMSTRLDSISAYGEDEKGRRSQVQSYNSNISSVYNLNSKPGSRSLEIPIFQGEEDDDWLHNSKSPSSSTRRGHVLSDGFPIRAAVNLGTLLLLLSGILMLFVGYPLLQGLRVINNVDYSAQGSSNLGGTNASGQVPSLSEFNLPSLVDPETPEEARTRTGFDGRKYKLVFSDEFNTEGRSFYPGDDPYWEAVDLWYWGTQNYEWYDPAAVTTSGGALQIALTETPLHKKNFRGGMLQSWNKFCFTGGYIEASVRLPGYSDVKGMWPAFWLLGNLGRPGYGASLEGTWPYSYETCDVGVLPNQTHYDLRPSTNAVGGTVAFNKDYNTSALSFLGGQKLSACVCPNEDHPGPKLSDGSWKGRGAPELDIFEAQTTSGSQQKMTVSQSGQFAPFNDNYELKNTSGPAWIVQDYDISNVNSYTGAAFQQAVSIVTETDQTATEKGMRGQPGTGGKFSTYGAEYHTGNEGDITFVSDDKVTWQLTKDAMAGDPISQISRRPIAAEPMAIILNLGMSQSFGEPEWDLIDLPSTMSVDFVRVYQPEDDINIGCDPPGFPTTEYIKSHPKAYNNAELQHWGLDESVGGYGANWPRQKLDGGCSVPAQNKPGIFGKEIPKAPWVDPNSLPNYS